MNLIFNARDAMPDGGTLSVRVREVVGTEVRAPDHIPARTTWIELSVQDTGSGIAAEHLTHIFQPFFTTKGSRKGTGLGLATVYEVVGAAGGWIEVDSRLNIGTTFRVYWPPADSLA